MEMFTDLETANAYAVKTGGPMYQTFQLPYKYAIGELTVEQEDDEEFMESVEDWSVIDTDYSDTEEENDADEERAAEMRYTEMVEAAKDWQNGLDW